MNAAFDEDGEGKGHDACDGIHERGARAREGIEKVIQHVGFSVVLSLCYRLLRRAGLMHGSAIRWLPFFSALAVLGVRRLVAGHPGRLPFCRQAGETLFG